MSNLIKRTATLAFAMTAALALAACDVDQTQEGELPNVDVEGGQVPTYEVETPDVEVDTKKVEVPVPDVDVTIPDDDVPDEEVPPQDEVNQPPVD